MQNHRKIKGLSKEVVIHKESSTQNLVWVWVMWSSAYYWFLPKAVVIMLKKIKILNMIKLIKNLFWCSSGCGSREEAWMQLWIMPISLWKMLSKHLSCTVQWGKWAQLVSWCSVPVKVRKFTDPKMLFAIVPLQVLCPANRLITWDYIWKL